MSITKISAHAGCTFNHPYESYSNFRFGVTIEADLQFGDDPIKSAYNIHERAQSFIEDQKQQKLAALKAEHDALMEEYNKRYEMAVPLVSDDEDDDEDEDEDEDLPV